MTRLIDADALKKAIYEWMPKDQTTWMDSSIPPIENLVVSIMMTIEEQPIIDEPQWIPCSERLPEERGFYLTTTKDKAVYCDFWNEDNFDRTEMVIAWMPLPKPYEVNSEICTQKDRTSRG